MILGLRLTEGVDLDQLSSVYRTDVRKKYGKKLADLADRELVELNGSVVRLTKEAWISPTRYLLSLSELFPTERMVGRII